MIQFPVASEKAAALLRRMQKLGIFESDLKETFIRSGGKGGQNVNKVATGVRLSHSLSGIDIKCSVYRTQGMNRYKARVILCEKIEEREREAASIENPEHRKIRLAKIDRARKARKKAIERNAGKPKDNNWNKPGEW
ncbi:MAG: peptide chain release factor-like protein [Leptospiraceae bacterium]|nr:peptide chain release factor-like protein [Leptospiraceae bacterium]MCB1202110.1 peptide chain release factor-like protein [Leptospiraceae bacterium]